VSLQNRHLDFWFVDQTLDNIFSTRWTWNWLFVNYPCIQTSGIRVREFQFDQSNDLQRDSFSLAFNSITNLTGSPSW